jgi:hypothetical protein
LMLLNKSEANVGVVSNPSTMKINIFLCSKLNKSFNGWVFLINFNS